MKTAYHHLMETYIKVESGSGSLMRLCTSIVQFGLPLMCMGGYLLMGGSLTAIEFIIIIIIGTKILTTVITAVNNMMMLRNNYVSAKDWIARCRRWKCLGQQTGRRS